MYGSRLPGYSRPEYSIDAAEKVRIHNGTTGWWEARGSDGEGNERKRLHVYMFVKNEYESPLSSLHEICNARGKIFVPTIYYVLVVGVVNLQIPFRI